MRSLPGSPRFHLAVIIVKIMVRAYRDCSGQLLSPAAPFLQLSLHCVMRVRTAHVIFNEMIYQSYKSRLPVVQTMPRLRSASCRTREIEILSRRITFMTSDLVGFIKCSEMYVNPGNKLGNLS
ncbi:hypothetical protein Zmor_009873 [Zophobas morio]|uniref:Uncharacterized protein n=1 Tax=Zophobas morio TaxID=2755281 RepID=A0AA38MIF9_9CUCU|nr:hypothetical protein Zmor_009865 [Zophobas morio]KAJ3658115.1 hypothetical protein Zmor_009873 [Zophobas morio]